MSVRHQQQVTQIPVDYHPVSCMENGNPYSNSLTENKPSCRRENGSTLTGEVQHKGGLCCAHSYIIPVFILIVLVLIVLLLPWETFHRNDDINKPIQAPLPCQLQLVETIPIDLNYTATSPKFMSTFEAWQLLLDKAKTSVDIASPHCSLRGVDVNDSSTQQGEELFDRLLSNGDGGKKASKLLIRIALNKNQERALHADAKIFANYGAAQVVDIKLDNSGVLQSNLWIVDGQHFYLGSASMDWQSLAQAKELGILALNCAHLARDVAKIFKAYWYLGSNINAPTPSQWPWLYHTFYNLQRPSFIASNKNDTQRVYISSAPPTLAPTGRTHDLDAILNAINEAEEFIYIAVMEYSPLIIHEQNVQYWPYIDNALRTAALERGVTLKLLISWWLHSSPGEDKFLRSLQELSKVRDNVDIQIRRFVVPMNKEQQLNNFTRVAHNVYMVTDNTVFIGTTPNWTGNYLTYCAGVGLSLSNISNIFSNTTLRTDLINLFWRDWHSPFAVPLKPNMQI